MLGDFLELHPRPGSSHIQHQTPASPARQQPHPADIRRWRRQSVQIGRKIFERLSRCNPWRDISSGRVAAPRETLNRRQCCSIGKQLRVDAETPDAGRPVEKRRSRNADAETPIQKRRCRNADAATPPWNATAQKQCAALGLMCPTLRKKSSKRASNRASKQLSKQTTEQASNRASKQPSK